MRAERQMYKYITNLSPLALPSPFTHTHTHTHTHTPQSQKSQRGGRDLIRLSAVHHTQGEREQGRETTEIYGGGGGCP